MGISWTKHNTRQLTHYNEVIAETKEYQPTSRAAVSPQKQCESTTEKLRSSRCRRQHNRTNQSGNPTRPNFG